MQGLDESSLGSQHIFNENKDLCFTIRFQATNRPRPPMEDIEIYYISKCMHFIAHLMEVIMLLHQQIYETGENITLHCLERDINTWA